MNSIEFLRRFHPTGFWVLTAIAVDRKGIETTTFTPDEADKAQKWLDKRAGKANIYFSVNQPSRKLNKKADRDDITSVGWLHVDIDARAGEPLDSELVRILGLLDDVCPVKKPTAVVYSGGGYQAFWRLVQPIEVKTTAQKAEIARYNKQIEIVLGGDSCFNIDRIMRLPGTMNIPNAKKVERGRVPAMAEVEWFDADTYELSEFTPAPDVQTEGLSNASFVSLPSGNIERLDNVNELDKWKVPDRVKVILVQGNHPDEIKAGDNSRSAWLFDAVCNLVRCEVPDEVIFSLLTDPDMGISASVLDKRPNEVEYATRQIERAKEEIEDPWLRELNERYAVIGNLGGKCRVIEEVEDKTTGRRHITKQTFQDFQNRYSHKYIQLGKRQVTVGQWWLAHPKRRQYDYLVFSPGGAVPNAYNLWQGFGCSPIPGENHLNYLKHIFHNICNGVEDHYRYILGWMARCVQKPDTPGETAIVMRGKSGTGKSFFATRFGELWGRHFLQVSDAKHLVGAFNAHLRDCVVLFGDEAFYAGDKKHESVLKTLITERRMIIEHKGVDAEVSPNFTHIIMASNSDWVVPTGATERRFFVLDVGDRHQQDSGYFRRIAEELDNGGRESLLHYLLTYDLTGFDVRKVPSTKALFEQKMHSLDPFAEWWYHRLSQGTLLESLDHYCPVVDCGALVEDYINHVKQFNVQRMGTATRLGIFLRNACPGDYPIRARSSAGTNRAYQYTFPPLQSLRDRWENHYDTKVNWPTEDTVPSEVPF